MEICHERPPQAVLGERRVLLDELRVLDRKRLAVTKSGGPGIGSRSVRRRGERRRFLRTSLSPGTEVQTDLPMESYGFTARIDADGSVRGRAVWQFRPQEARFRGVFTCLHVDGAEAWLGGEFTRVDVEGFPPLPIYFVWQVRDNGEGGNAARTRSASCCSH